MSSPVSLPSPDNDYAAPAGTIWNPATYDAVMGSIGARLRGLEAQKSTIEDLINELKMFGLQRLDEAIQPLIDEATETLAAIEMQTAALQEAVDQILAGGVPASSVTLEAVVGIEALNVQAVIAELLAKISTLNESKAPKDSPEFTGTVKLPNGLEIKSDTLPFGIVKRKARTADAALEAADFACLIDITSGTFSQTFADAATLGDGWWCYLRNSGSGDITLDPNGSETIDGLASYVMYPGECRIVLCDGASLRSVIINAFYKVFTASANFVKPPGYQAFEGLIWGGGASGKRSGSNKGDGGPGGACAPVFVRASGIAASEAVTIGAGGAGSTINSFNPGGNSVFASISAFGGSNAGGGSAFFSGVRTNGGSPIIGGAGTSQYDVEAYFGGGCMAVNSVNTPTPLRTVYGGGAGGGPGDTTGMNAPTDTVFGGRGGVGFLAANGADGEAPGGGGGGTRTGTASGAGARGELRLWGII